MNFIIFLIELNWREQMEIMDFLGDKKIVICGTNKYQKDFQYIFDNLEVEFYIKTHGENHSVMTKKVFDITELDYSILSDKMVIICEGNFEYVETTLKNLKLEYKKNYIFAKDLFVLLDKYNSNLIIDKKVVIWGTGETAENLQKIWIDKKYNINVDFYLDGDKTKSGTMYNNKIVKHISDLSTKDYGDFLIVVASVFYYEIKEKLQSYGLLEGNNFLPYTVFESIPSEMLLKTICDKPILNWKCPRPFMWFYYAWYGIYSCCSTWVNEKIGNPVSDTPEEAWNSNLAKIFRLSILNGTYSFCKKDACPYLKSPELMSSYRAKDFVEVPEYITLGLDFTCNLKCISCRNDFKIASGNQLELRESFAKKILQTKWLEKTKYLELSGTGEVLASKVDKKILYKAEVGKRKSISLMTNALLLNREEWEKIRSSYEDIHIKISIDAATKETYESIRRGGNWDVLMKNLEMISGLRAKNEIKYFEIRMVVQRRNYQEIISFAKLGEFLGVDKVVFSKILNWDLFNSKEYYDISMIDENGILDQKLESILKNPILKKDFINLNEFKAYL